MLLIPGCRQWTRNCPSCSREITYKHVSHRNYADRNNQICQNCSAKRRVVSEKTKQLISKNHARHNKGKSSPMRGIARNVLVRQKMSENSARYWSGRKMSNETKMKMRLSAIERIKFKRGSHATFYNPTACKYFELLNSVNGWNGRHAMNGGEYSVLGYFLDYYEPSLNLVIEWDEKRHYDVHENLKVRDVNRQQQIEEHLNCRFIRIKEWQPLPAPHDILS